MRLIPFCRAVVCCLTLCGVMISGATMYGEESVREERGLSYKEGSTDPQDIQFCLIDFYLPTTPAFPTLVWFHGGGLVKGKRDSADNVAIAQRFAARGIAVAMVGYRLSPAVTYPAYVEDAAAAVAHVSKHIAARGGNPQRIFVGGHSAGGYLALMLALDTRYLAKHGIAENLIAGYLPVAGQTVTHWTIRAERGIPKNAVVVDEAAPLFYVREKTQPLFLIAADNDAPARAEENKLLHACLIGAGNKNVSLHVADDRTHESVSARLSHADDPVRLKMEAFIQQH
jgi:acetyl esterase/lipase